MSVSELKPLLGQHRPFALVSSLGLALLYAEEGWATHSFWGSRSSADALVLISVISLIVFVGYLVSFILPPLLVNEKWVFPRAWGVLSTVTAWSVGITVVVNIIAFAFLIYLVNYDLVAVYNLLRDIYIYTLVAMLFFHGLLLYVRYATFLYQTPGFVQPLKVIAASVGIGVMILIIVGFVFTLDIHRMDMASPAQEGLLGLHVYLRSLYLLTLIISAYAWHLRWIADH